MVKNSDSPLYSKTNKQTTNKFFWMEQSHAYKGYASIYSVKTLNSFNPELQLKNTESAIKNKLIHFLFELRGYKFVATLVL